LTSQLAQTDKLTAVNTQQ